MKQKLMSVAALAAFAAMATGAMATPEGWTDDFAAARAQAAKEGKCIFMYFYKQSDFHRAESLEENVFSSEAFVEAAKKDYVLVAIEVPTEGSDLPKKVQRRNRRVAKTYDAELWLPILKVLDSDGIEVVTKTSAFSRYDKSPARFLKELNGWKASAMALEEFDDSTDGLEKGSAERVAKIDELFQKIGEEEAGEREYADLVKELLANDKDGKYAAKYPNLAYVRPAFHLYCDVDRTMHDNEAEGKKMIPGAIKAIKELKASAPKSVHGKIDGWLEELEEYAK